MVNVLNFHPTIFSQILSEILHNTPNSPSFLILYPSNPFFPLLLLPQHSSDTREAHFLRFNANGNLELRREDSTVIWESGTASAIAVPFAKEIVFNDDGRLVMWSTHGSLIWSANVLGKVSFYLFVCLYIFYLFVCICFYLFVNMCL